MKTVARKKKTIRRKRKPAFREKSLLERFAEDSSWYVLSAGTRAAIERNAEEYHRKLLADPTYREDLRRMTDKVMGRLAPKLRAPKSRASSRRSA